MESLREIVSGLNRLKGKITVVVIGQICVGVGAFVGIRLLTEIISPGVFGQYKLVFSGVSLSVGVLVSPMIHYAMREFHDARENEIESEFVHHMLGIFLWSTLICVAGLTLILSATAGSKIGWAPLLCAALIVWLQAFFNYERAMFVIRDKQKAAALLNNYEIWVTTLVIALFVWIFRESLGVIMAGTLIPLAAMCLFLAFRYTGGRNPTSATQIGLSAKKTLRKAFKYCWPLAMIGALSWVLNECDRFFLVFYHDDHVVGTYSAAYGLVSAPFAMASGAVASIAFPIIFQEAAAKAKARSSFGMILTVNILICAAGVSAVAVFGGYLANIGLAAQYREPASKLFIWVALGYGFYSIATTFDLMAYASRRTPTMFFAYGIAAGVNLIGNYLLIPEQGAIGAAKSTTVGMLAYLIVIILFSKNNVSVQESNDLQK